MTRRYVLHACLLAIAWLRCAAADEAAPKAANDPHAELRQFALASTPQLRALGFDVLTYPRMCGSTSTQPLAALIACRCFGLDYEWVGREQRLPPWELRPARLPPWQRHRPGAEDEWELLEFTLQARWKTPAEERLALIINGLLSANSSTHNAYIDVIEGRSDIGLLARPPSQSELSVARTKGIEIEALPVALDALVFIIHSSNPVRSLTTNQIKRIYANRPRDWIPYHREENSGSEELMRTLVMAGTPFYVSATGERQMIAEGLMSSIFLALRDRPSGIGYSVFYYERYMMRSPETKVIAVDGVEPTFETIRDRKYPYTCEVFVVTRKGLAPDAPARKLRDWLRSAEGQAVVRESGYVPCRSVER